MRIDTSAWHYRLNEWAWGWSYFWKWDLAAHAEIRKPVALCPYVDRLIIAVVLSPFIFGWRQFHDNGKLAFSFTALGVVVGLVNGLILGNFLFSLAISLGFTWGFGGLMYVIFHVFGNDYEPPKKKEQKPQKEPGLLRQWLDAKHRKICPFLTFDDQET